MLISMRLSKHAKMSHHSCSSTTLVMGWRGNRHTLCDKQQRCSSDVLGCFLIIFVFLVVIHSGKLVQCVPQNTVGEETYFFSLSDRASKYENVLRIPSPEESFDIYNALSENDTDLNYIEPELSAPLSFVSKVRSESRTLAKVTDRLPAQSSSLSFSNNTVSQMKSNTNSSFTATVYGSLHATAYYFVNFGVGLFSRQRQSVILDSGSSVLAFPCSSCVFCGTNHIDPPLDLSLAKSAQIVPCNRSCTYCNNPPTTCAYIVNYVEESSIKGLWYFDHFAFEQIKPEGTSCLVEKTSMPQRDLPQTCLSSRSIVSPFGCHVEETHLFTSQKASGILGLEVHSQYGPSTFIQAAMRYTIPPLSKKWFSICLGAEGGLFTVGGDHAHYHLFNSFTESVDNKTDRTLPEPEIKWTPFARDRETYTIGIISMKVGSNIVECNNHIVDRPYASKQMFTGIVDSGTTLTYFPECVYNQILKYIRNHVGAAQNSEFLSQRVIGVNENESDHPSRRFEVNSPNNKEKSVSHIANLRVLNDQIQQKSENSRRLYELSMDRMTGSYNITSEFGNHGCATSTGLRLDQTTLFSPAEASAPLRRARAISVNNSKEVCWFFSNWEEDLMLFPNITISLVPSNMYFAVDSFGSDSTGLKNPGIFTWQSNSYLYQKGNPKSRCLAFALDTDASDGFILGSSFMVHHDIIFDVENFHLGFAPASCPPNSHHIG